MMREMQLLITSTCRRLSVLSLGAVMLFLAACGGKETKKGSQPAPQALAPAPQAPQTPAEAKVGEASASHPAQAQQPEVKPEVPDAVVSTIAEAEKAYNVGLEDYKAGHLDTAKQDFKEGDGFTEQNPEPAPIDEANSVTFPVDPNVKAKAEADLPTLQSDLPL